MRRLLAGIVALATFLLLCTLLAWALLRIHPVEALLFLGGLCLLGVAVWLVVMVPVVVYRLVAGEGLDL